MIASRTDVTTPPEGFSLRTIPASTWAIFTSVGPLPGAIQSVFGRIFQEWFPATGYKHAEAPVLEVYPREIRQRMIISARYGFPL